MSKRYVANPNEKPPTGIMGGSVADWERGIDPFSRECFPDEFQNFFEDRPAEKGWLALDWCGNIIGFIADGNSFRYD